ncbi:MAG: hypothetical protein IPQ04_05815 [Saprospiraceae bacterium]|nr:hypothetical protein [Saprospiraceae bacterium]
MSGKITNFMSVHIMMIIETITLFRNMSERMELQIPVVLYRYFNCDDRGW